MDSFLMTSSEVREYLGISMSKLKRLEADKILQPCRRLEGGKKLYSSDEVYAYMNSLWTGGSN